MCVTGGIGMISDSMLVLSGMGLVISSVVMYRGKLKVFSNSGLYCVAIYAFDQLGYRLIFLGVRCQGLLAGMGWVGTAKASGAQVSERVPGGALTWSRPRTGPSAPERAPKRAPKR